MIRWTISFALACAIAAPTSAQHATLGSRAVVVNEYGRCVARQDLSRAQALMATEIASREEARQARNNALAYSACLRQPMLRLRTGEVRGTVAEALLERDPEAMARLATMPSRAPVRAASGRSRAFIIGYARCIADAEPAKAMRILAAEPDSVAEREAVAALGQVLMDCMPLDASWSLDIFDLRNHLAPRLYELATPTAG